MVVHLKRLAYGATVELWDAGEIEKVKADNPAVGIFFGDKNSKEFAIWYEFTATFDEDLAVFYHVCDPDLRA